MKTKSFRLLTVLLTVILMAAMSLNVMAAKSNAVTRDGLTAQLLTDKDSYKSGESVKVAVQVDNHTGRDVFVFAQINVPEGVKLASESTAFDARLQDGESWTTPGGEILSAGGKTTTGTTATGDNMQAGFYIILTALAVCGIIALFVYGKNRKACLSIMLCLAMIGGMVVAAVPAQAADINGEIPLSCSITVDGKAAELTANVSYVIYDDEAAEESAEAPTATEVPEATEAPTATEAPEATEPPTATEAPEATEPPTATEAPEATEPPTATEAPTELNNLFIMDGGFESADTGTDSFTYWKANSSSYGSHVATENTHSGNYALQVNNKNDRVYQLVKVVPGVEYELTGYVHLAANTGNARFGFIGYSQGEINDTYQTFVEGNIRFDKYATIDKLQLENDTLVRGEWMKFSYTVEATEDTNYLCVYFEGLSGVVFYDDISIYTVKKSDDFILDSGFESADVESGTFALWEEQNGKADYSLVATENTHAGNYALQVENKNDWGRQFFAVDPLSKYEVTGWVRLTDSASNARLKYEGYSENEISRDYSAGSKEVNFAKYQDFSDLQLANDTLVIGDWIQFSWIISTDEDTRYLALYFRGNSGIAMFDDVSVYKLQDADRLSVILNSNNYYSTETEGIATLIPNTTAYTDISTWKANCYVLKDGNSVWSKENVDLSTGEQLIPFSLANCSGKDYIFRAVLYVNGVETETAEWSFNRYYERPTVLNDTGIYSDGNGGVFHPVFTYHMLSQNTNLSGENNAVFDCIDRLGVNVFQFDKGYVQEENWDKALEHLDILASKGAKAIICLYPGNKICSDPSVRELVTNYMNQIKDHPAVFAWGIQDEPAGKGTSEELLREAFAMVHEIDPTRPVYTLDQREHMYPILVRNADVVTIDNYPYGMFDAMTYIYDSTKYAVELASYSNKPVYTLLQCFARYHGPYMDPSAAADELYMPSRNTIRNMIYQSFMAGVKGFGYYGFDYGGTPAWSVGNSSAPNVRTASDTAKGIQEFAAKEQDIMFEYFVEGKYPTFNSNVDGDADMRYISFVRGGKIYMVILNKHEFAQQTVSVPLTSNNENVTTQVTITGYTAMGYAGGATDTNGTGSTLDVTLEPGAAAVYIVTPNETVDWSEFSGGNNPEDTVPEVTIPDDTEPDGGDEDNTDPENPNPEIPAQDTANLITNGGFEIPAEGDANAFASWQALDNNYTYVATSNAHSGNTALQVNNKNDRVYQLIEVTPGIKYELTGYVHLAANTGNARFGVIGYSQEEATEEYQTFIESNIRFGDYASIEKLKLENDTLVQGDWMKFTYTVEATETTNYLYVHFESLSGISLYDDISLYETAVSGN